MKKIGLILSITIAILICIVFGFLWSKTKSFDQTIQLEGAKDSIRVVYDENAIPHIYANNNEDAFLALGYVHASDRLFQMELLRHVGEGSLSEVFGSDLIDTDTYLKTIGINENAKNSAKDFEQNASQSLKDEVNAYIKGVNQYIQYGKRPIEFDILGIDPKPYTTTDIFRVLGYMGFGFSMELKTEPLYDWILQNHGPEYLQELGLDSLTRMATIPAHEDTSNSDWTALSTHIDNILSDFPVPLFMGSNSWVIGPKKSNSKKVLFANDTHIGFAQPSVWYEAHIHTPTINVYGNFAAGVPYPLIGHNLNYAWGLTIFPVDQIDLYKENISGDSVMYKNEWVPIAHRMDTIRVKGASEVVLDIASTPHGPLIHKLSAHEQLGAPISMYWVASQVKDRKLEAIGQLARGTDTSDYIQACKWIDSPGLNVMYGDKEGNIGWIASAKLIQRADSITSKLILDGATGQDDPKGFYSFDYNPKNINPKEGYVYSANNQPGEYKSLSHPGNYYPGGRAQVIIENISNQDNWDIEKMKDLVMNDQSPYYPENIQLMSKHIVAINEVGQAGLEIAKNWDGNHQLTAIGPVIYYKWIYHVLRLTMMDELKEDNFDLFLSTSNYLRAVHPLLTNPQSVWWDNIETENQETQTEILQTAFDQTMMELETQFGNDVNLWTWNKAHFYKSPHPLGKQEPLDMIFDVGPIPSPGGEEVLNKMAFLLNGDGIYISKSGPAMRILIDFADIENSLSINPTGQSGNFMSPYYSNQAEDFVSGGFRKQKMDKEDIILNQIGTWTIIP